MLRRALLMSCFFIALMSMAVYAEELKIGYVDTQRVLDESDLGKQVKEELNVHVQSRQQIIDLEEGELKKLQDELSRQGAVLSDKVRAEKEEAFQRKLMDYQKKVADLQREIQTKKVEKLKEFNDRLIQISKKIAEAEGLSAVFTADAESGSILYAKPSLDMTQKMIQELNKIAKEEKGSGK
ncbi:MAG: OmpH family outer membrane protein [Nitrospirae bacterium]|nr:OmpH family outer membrane protein [Nitrospirota bacterium]